MKTPGLRSIGCCLLAFLVVGSWGELSSFPTVKELLTGLLADPELEILAASILWDRERRPLAERIEGCALLPSRLLVTWLEVRTGGGFRAGIAP